MMEFLAFTGVSVIALAALLISVPAALIAGLGSAVLGYALFHDPDPE